LPLPSIKDDYPLTENELEYKGKSLESSRNPSEELRTSFHLERGDSDIFDLTGDNVLSFPIRKNIIRKSLPTKISSADVFYFAEKESDPDIERSLSDLNSNRRGSAPITFQKFETIKKKVNSANQVKLTKEKKPHAVTLFLHQVLARTDMFLPYLDKLHLFVDAMESEDVLKGHTIIKQGDDGDFFYVVESGKVDIIVDENLVAVASVGEVFGELALLYTGKRAASCIATTECKLWKINSLNFRLLIDEAKSENQVIFKVLRNLPLLAGVPPRQIVKITEAARVVFVDDYDNIYSSYDEAEAIFYITKGSVVINDYVSKSKNMLAAGELFGQTDIITGSLRTSSATAVGNVELIVLETKSIESITGKKLCDLLGKEELMKNLVRRIMCVLTYANFL